MTTGDSRAWDGAPTSAPKVIGGRYELGALLGHGGMAVVRLGTDLRLNRPVAVKLLRGELADSPSFQARFRREARAAAALDHPAIVRVYDAGEESVDGVSTSYIVMEYVEGQTLRDWLRTAERDLSQTLRMTAELLDALAASHRCGIIHRDIKPANVMVTPNGAVKMMDFGVARALADMSASLTQTSTVVGTAHYLSPEQARGEMVDERSDVYSTGCLLYELLTGRPPFVGDSAIAVAYQHVREPAQPPSSFEPSLPPEVDAVVMAALAKRPADRYQSADQMRRDIVAVLSGREVLSAPATAQATTVLPQVVPVDGPASTTRESEPVQAPVLVPASAGRSRRRLGMLAAAVALLVATTLGAFALDVFGQNPEVAQRTQQAADGNDRDADPSPGTTDSSDSVDTTDDGSAAVGTNAGDTRQRDAKPNAEPTRPEESEKEDDPADGSAEPAPTPEPRDTPSGSAPPSDPPPDETPPSEPAPSEPAASEPAPSEPAEPAPTTPSEPAPSTSAAAPGADSGA